MFRRWSRSLRLKSAIALTIVLVVFLIIATFIVISLGYNSHKQLLTKNATGMAAISVRPIVEDYLATKDAFGFQLTQVMKTDLQNLPLIDSFQILSMDNEVLYDSYPLKHSGASTPLKTTNIATQIQSNTVTPLISGTTYAVFVPYFDAKDTHVYTIRYTIDFSPLNSETTRAAWEAAIMILVIALTSFLLLFRVIQQLVIDPISKIRSEVNTMIEGNPDERINLRSNNEFNDLAQSINLLSRTLSDKVKKLEEEKAWKNEFIILASHNLRTPLSVIMSSVSALKKDAKLSESNLKLIDYIYTRGKELHGLIENLLSISMLKGDRVDVAKESFDLMAVVNAIAKDQENRLRDRGLKMTIETMSHHVIVRGDEGQMFQILDNLVDNAIKFTEKGGITIGIDDSKQMIKVTVKDTGVGIDEKMLQKLFQSFHRGADPLSVDHKGAGLGLYFVKLAIESQGGEVSIKSKPGQGTEISITMPRA